VLCSDSWGSIYDGQADRAIWEFCYLATRSRDPTSESLEPIQSARAEYDLCAAFSEHDRSRFAHSTALSACPPRRANAFGARAGDDDDLVFDSRHEVLLSSLYEFRAPLGLNSQPLTTQLLRNHYRARNLPSKQM
jgi:hypothetical protein